MIKTLKPSTTEDDHPKLLCCFPSSQANRDCMSPEDCWICAVLESWQIFCQRTHLIRHLPSHASRTYHMDNEQLEVWENKWDQSQNGNAPRTLNSADFQLIGKDTMKSLGISTNIIDGIFTWNELAIPMVSKGHWTKHAINTFLHHFRKPTPDSISLDSIAAPTTTVVNPTSNSNTTDTKFAMLSAHISRSAPLWRAQGR